MSKLGIGLLYFALVGALAAVFGGYMAYNKFNTDKASIADAQAQQQVAAKAAAKATKEAKEANDAKDTATSQLTDAQGKVDDLNTKLAAVQKTSDDANAAIAQAKADGDKAKADLQHIKDVLGDMAPEDVKGAIDKANAAVAASQSQQKILEDQLQAAQTQMASLKDSINRAKTGDMPPGISGKVTFVNHTWNFVVLNVGLSNGVVPNGELIIYRGKNFLGKIRVTTAESTTAVADILPDAKDIQAGDDVIN